MEEKQYYETLPKKRMGAGVIFFNNKKELLFVKPTYKDHWIFPGGVVEKDESPRICAIREVEEELGLTIFNLQFVCIDWKEANDSNPKENMQFLFFGGVLSQEAIQKIQLPEEELSAFQFFPLNDLPAVSSNMKNRISYCIKAIQEGSSLYLENGMPVNN